MKQPKIQSLIRPKAEAILRQIILKDLQNKGRKNYDKPHTEAVVYWMKHLLTHLNTPHSTSQTLITAAYAHDWGYSRIQGMSESNDFKKVIQNKTLHMQFSAEMIEQLLYSRLAKYYTEQQKLRIIHLVSAHDKVWELTQEDELLLMEADTLGMIDRNRVTPTFSPADIDTFLKKSIYNLRLPRFIHPEAKQIAEELLKTYTLTVSSQL